MSRKELLDQLHNIGALLFDQGKREGLAYETTLELSYKRESQGTCTELQGTCTKLQGTCTELQGTCTELQGTCTGDDSSESPSESPSEISSYGSSETSCETETHKKQDQDFTRAEKDGSQDISEDAKNFLHLALPPQPLSLPPQPLALPPSEDSVYLEIMKNSWLTTITTQTGEFIRQNGCLHEKLALSQKRCEDLEVERLRLEQEVHTLRQKVLQEELAGETSSAIGRNFEDEVIQYLEDMFGEFCQVLVKRAQPGQADVHLIYKPRTKLALRSIRVMIELKGCKPANVHKLLQKEGLLKFYRDAQDTECDRAILFGQGKVHQDCMYVVDGKFVFVSYGSKQLLASAVIEALSSVIVEDSLQTTGSSVSGKEELHRLVLTLSSAVNYHKGFVKTLGDSIRKHTVGWKLILGKLIEQTESTTSCNSVLLPHTLKKELMTGEPRVSRATKKRRLETEVGEEDRGLDLDLEGDF
jgi:hypothetical protein